MVTEKERGNSFRTTVTFMSSNQYVDPSSNIAWIQVYKSDGTSMLSNASGTRQSTGIYYYYISTQSTDPLGLYVVDWYGYFPYGSPFLYLPKHEREVVSIVYVE